MVFKQLSAHPLEGSPAWDQYQGLSFMVKGDGSDLFGCISVGDRATGAYSYIYTKAYFKQSMGDYIQGAINQTQGKSAILPFATTPSTGPRFVMMAATSSTR
ncbi:MAG: hypothetical protein L3J39_14810 [Verrucomicrobiales bacterium]|nr:hypothetical protein [Verrucomicrobiales bacterium]